MSSYVFLFVIIWCSLLCSSHQADFFPPVDNQIMLPHVIFLRGQKVRLHNKQILHANKIYLDVESLEIEQGSGMSATEGVYVKTSSFDNSGFIKGIFVLDFTGELPDLKRIGTVDCCMYRGSVSDSLADALVGGNNDIITIGSGGSIAIDTPSCVHLKQEHRVEHAVHVMSHNSVHTHKHIESTQSIYLDAANQLSHQSIKAGTVAFLKGSSLSACGTTERLYGSTDYTDVAIPVIVSGNPVVIRSQNDATYSLVSVQSGILGTHVHVGGNFFSLATMVEQYKKTETYKKRWIFKNVTTTQEEKELYVIPNLFKSNGATKIMVEGSAELHATVFNSEQGSMITANKGIKPIVEKNIHVGMQTIKQGGFNEKLSCTQWMTCTEVPIKCDDHEATVFNSPQEMVLTITGTSPSVIITAPQVTCTMPSKTTDMHTDQQATYVFLWNNAHALESHDVTYDNPYRGCITVDACIINVHDISNTSALHIDAVCEHAVIHRELLENISECQKITHYNRPTQLALNLVALSLSLAASYVAPFIGAGIAYATHNKDTWMESLMVNVTTEVLNSLCAQAITTLLMCDGDIRKAMYAFAHTDTIQRVALASIAAGTTVTAGYVFDTMELPSLHQAESLCECLLCVASPEILNAGILCAVDCVQGKDIYESAEYRARGALANAVGIACPYYIDCLYDNAQMSSIKHTVLHAFSGAVQGGVMGGLSGALAGGVGAGLSEIIAKLRKPKTPSFMMIKKEKNHKDIFVT